MPNDHAGLPVPLAGPLSLSEYHARRQQPENRPLHDDADDLLLIKKSRPLKAAILERFLLYGPSPSFEMIQAALLVLPRYSP